MPQDENTPRPTLSHKLEQLIQIIFGSVRYSPPPWMKKAFASFAPVSAKFNLLWQAIVTRAREEKATNPRRFWAKSGALTLGLITVIIGIIWYQSRPKPYLIEVTGTSPTATALREGAKPDSITVNFSDSAARIDLVGKTVQKGIRISPLIQGDWKWVNDRELRFTPKEDWAVGESYSVAFDRNLLAAHVKLKRYSYDFNSAPFQVSISNLEFYQDPKVQADKKITATVRFSHPVNAKDFEGRISLTLKEKDAQNLDLKTRSLNYTVTYDKYKGEAYILTERLTLPASDSPVILVLDKGMRSERGGPNFSTKVEKTVNVPGLLSYFKIANIYPTQVRNEQFEPEQVLIVESTASVTAEEMNKNIQAYLLPIDRPESPGQKAQKKHYWSDPGEIGPPILKVSEPVKLEAIPIEFDHATTHTYRYKAPVGRHLYVKVSRGAKAFGDYVLAKDFDRVIRVPEYPTELQIMSEGSLLSLSGKRKLSVLSRGISDMRFEVGRVIGSQVNHLISQAQGSFTNPIFQEYRFSADHIVERFTEERSLGSTDPQKAQYTGFDFGPYLNKPGVSKKGLFLLKVQKYDPETKSAGEPTAQRLILLTDLGILSKKNADGSHDVFVQSIATGNPVAGASVDVLGANGVAVVTQSTNGDGKAHFSKLEGLIREKRPIAFLVHLGNDFSFLPFDRYDRELSYSRFDVGGNYVSSPDGLTAYLFSDRGIYRPGEEAKVGMIVRSNDWKIQKDAPLEVVVSDPRGLEVFKKKISLTADGFQELTYGTDESSLTGPYQVSLYIVKDSEERNLIGSTTLRFEEFEPDKLRISSRLSETKAQGWISPTKLKATVNLQTLFGFAAANRVVKAEIDLYPTPPSFKKYSEYHFFDPIKTEKSFSETLPDISTNELGVADFDLNLERFEQSTYRLRFFAEGFEAEGGRGVATESLAMVSPLQHMVGYRTDGDLKYVSKDSDRSVHLIAIDSSVNPKQLKSLSADLVEIKYVSSLTKSDDGTFRYQSVRKEIPKLNKPLEIAATGTNLILPTDAPGDYAFLIRDETKTILNRIEFSVTGSGNLARSLEKSSILRLKLNKSDFAPGESIEVQVVAPFAGAGLITIERDKVYAHKWIKASTTSSLHSISIPQGLEGNAYVNVAFVRSLDSAEIFMSPLSYAVAPFSISKERRRHKIELEVADKVLPGEKLTVRYKTDSAARIVLFGVDEGILQVAHYENPDPLAFFLQKRSLQVSTTQILDLILPEFNQLEEQSSAGGGEGSLAGKGLNPFRRRRDKAVVFWSGIMESGTQFKEYTYEVPDSFNGTMRVLAVAISPQKLGAVTDSVISRGPFVISPTVPFFVAPGDEFQVSAAIANDVEGSGKDAAIEVQLKTGPELEIVGEPKLSVKVSEKAEGVARFTLKAKERLGSASLKFTASLNGKSLGRTTDLSVRPPTHFQTTVASGFMKAGASKDVAIDREVYLNLRKAQATVGYLPLGLAQGLLSYLTTYPYLCTEQQVSRAFPALVLRKFPEFGNAPDKVSEILNQVFNILRARQNDQGAFGFWAANSHISPFQTAYAAHFLTEAKEAGFVVSDEMLARALGYLTQMANGDLSTLAGQRDAAYAAYLLVRNGSSSNRLLSNLYDKLQGMKDKAWKKDLTAIYLGASYAIIQNKNRAWELMNGIKPGETVASDYEHFYDSVVRDAQYYYVIAKHFPDRLTSLKPEEVEASFRPVFEGNYNTINSSYSILALSAMAEKITESPALSTTVHELLKDGKRGVLNLTKTRFPAAEFSEKATALSFKNASERPLYYSVSQTGYDREVPKKERQDGVEVTREYQSASGATLKEGTLGEEIVVRLGLRAPREGAAHVAVVELLPGGFEVVRDSIRKVNANGVGSAEEGSEEPEGGEGEGARVPHQEDAHGEEGMEGQEGAFFNKKGLRLFENLFRIPEALADEIAPENLWTPDYVDIREDRVLLFGYVPTQAKFYTYRIKPTNEGKFIVPPLYAEGMYDRRLKANTKAGEWFQVKAQKK